MREIVDKHFPDNWVLPIYQGYLIDLTEYWKSFDAAQKALENNMYGENLSQIAGRYQEKIKSLKKELRYFLISGKLNEEYVLDNMKKLMDCLRDCNVTIRWLMLHWLSA